MEVDGELSDPPLHQVREQRAHIGGDGLVLAACLERAVKADADVIQFSESHSESSANAAHIHLQTAPKGVDVPPP